MMTDSQVKGIIVTISAMSFFILFLILLQKIKDKEDDDEELFTD